MLLYRFCSKNAFEMLDKCLCIWEYRRVVALCLDPANFPINSQLISIKSWQAFLLKSTLPSRAMLMKFNQFNMNLG